MTELYTSGERALTFSLIFGICFIISFIFLCRRVNCKKISLIIFVLCLIYSSSFFFLDVIAMLDLFLSASISYEKFTDNISTFYFIFDLTDKIFGFVLINVYISYKESGHYNIFRKLIDFIVRPINSFLKLGKIKLIIISSVIVIMLAGFFALIIYYKKHFELTNALDYIFIFLDFYALFEIYSNVGFFIAQIFIDRKRHRDVILINRYYRYSIIKIIEKTEKYIKKIKKSQEILDEEVKRIDKNSNSDYNKYIEEILKEIEEQINILELEGNSENLNDKNNVDIINNNYMNNNNNNYMNNNNNYIYNNNYMNNNNNNYIYNNNYMNNNYNLNFNTNNVRMFKNKENENRNNYKQNELKIKYETQDRKTNEHIEIQNKEINKEEKKDETEEKKEEKERNDVPTSIRKYKNSIRRIAKLKLLYKEIQKEKEDDLSKVNKKCSFPCKLSFLILLIAFFIIFLTDFLLPLILHSNEDEDVYEGIEDEDFEKEESTLEFIWSVLITMALSILCSAYTIVKIYSGMRKQYISGDFLYDKQINDNLSLVKTVQMICGDAFALVFCNLYYYKSFDKNGVFNKANLYEEFNIPDYNIISGLSVYMIAKIVVIIFSQIATLKLNNFFVFKNDLGEYNLTRNGCKYDSDFELNKILNEKRKVNNILSK